MTIDELYNIIDQLIDEKKFEEIETIINNTNTNDIQLIIAFLTITHTKRNYINNRHKLIELVKYHGKQQQLTEKQINSILHGFC